LEGDSNVEAIGWAKERREELRLRKEEKEENGDVVAETRAKEQKLVEEKMMINIQTLVDIQKKVEMLLIIIVLLLCLVCCVMFPKNNKSARELEL
jgi:hypothetical protein